MRYLLAAEADQIQDFIFRTSHLREVVGGSQLLTRFSRKAPQLLLPPGAEMVVHDGGSFRVLFNKPEQATTFGAELAEIYRRAAGGTLTVAGPVPVDRGFKAASEAVGDKLREAKRRRTGSEAAVNLPYIALCASCGVGLAVRHEKRREDELRGQYLCAACRAKTGERDEKRAGEFLEPFLKVTAQARLAVGDELDAIRRRLLEDAAQGCEKALDQLKWPEDADEVTGPGKGYDPRNYVAYLLADGNGIGGLFAECTVPEQMNTLSKCMTETLRKSLAGPTACMMRWAKAGRECFVPVLPLILGGDDVFVLLPAPWALDFAQEFCRVFEAQMAAVVEKEVGLKNVPRPTVAAVIVICKANYPYSLAHEAGQKRLKWAKRLSKVLAQETGQHLSVVDCEVIVRGQIVVEDGQGTFRSSLRPYWLGQPPTEWGLPLQALLDSRYKLRSLPGKRRQELRGRFDLPALPASGASQDVKPWDTALKRLLGRIGRDERHQEAVEGVLAALGSSDESRWLQVRRAPESIWYGHGLPDLLDAWGFALKLDRDPRDYEEA